MRPREPVQIASIQTLHARGLRGSRITLPPAHIVIIDEAHHCRAGMWGTLLAAYPDAVILGMTATPCRRDGRGLGNVFDVLVDGPQVPDLIAAGYLVPTRVYAPTRPDVAGVRLERGGYNEPQLAERMDRGSVYGTAEKFRFHSEHAWIARERGYAAGWVAHKYRERFGEWPPTRFVDPLEATAATRAWVPSRLRAYAKSLDRAAL